MDNSVYFIILIILAVLLFILLKLPAKKYRKELPKSTNILPHLFVEQLNPKTMRVHKTYSITRDKMLSTGAVITREGQVGDVVLDCAFKETESVGRQHAVVAMDEFGCFIQSSHTNGISLKLYGDPVPEVHITPGIVVYLGEQPIRFAFPSAGSRKSGILDICRWIWNNVNKVLSFRPRRSRSNRSRNGSNNNYYSSQDDMW